MDTLTDDTPSRYTLDEIWDDDFRLLVLLSGFWNFATRSIQIEFTGDVDPDFGYRRAFSKPTDWVKTAAVSLDGDFSRPLNDYADEQDYWFAHVDTLFIKYISSDIEYGYDLASWPTNMTRFAYHLMAAEGCERITQSRVKKSDMQELAEGWLSKATATDAQNQPTVFPPRGTWARNRHRGNSGATRRSGGWDVNQ